MVTSGYMQPMVMKLVRERFLEKVHAFFKSKYEPVVRQVMAISLDQEIPTTRLDFLKLT